MPRRGDEDGNDHQRCELCQRDVPSRLITLHHLIPRQKGGTAEHRAPLCKPCHKQVHATYGNAELARLYDSVESLRNAKMLQGYLRWIRQRSPARNFQTRQSKAHPHHGRRRH